MAEGKSLRNEDFRKLLATPSIHSTNSGVATTREHAPSHNFTHKQTEFSKKSSSKGKQRKHFAPPPTTKVDDEKESIYNESQAKLNEILTKYRDRASERRKGMVPEDEDLRMTYHAAYKTAPNVFTSTALSGDRRKLEIQESKYLGGDIEHTHLVKGLDYSLLNKVRNEIEIVEKDKQLDKALEERESAEPTIKQANSRLAKNICQVLFENKPPQRNENFAARNRLAYIVELEDDVESDVPATLLRSVHDCPTDQSSENVNADNVLINKLTQILAYLRADTKKRKKGGAGTVERDTSALMNQKIYEEARDYVSKNDKQSTSYKRETAKPTEKERPKSYFDSSSRGQDRDAGGRDRNRRDREDREQERDQRKREEDRFRAAEDLDRKREREEEEDGDDEIERIKKRRLDQEEAYSEFYPMGAGMFEAGGDSDDEADYSKMDMGNRKGPIKRWDFDNEEEYERYQGQREAMPRAAYQFGVKMNAGRKTKKNVSAANEKKLDRELAKINKIIESRGGTSSSNKKIVY